jgi:hypothetical protein
MASSADDRAAEDEDLDEGVAEAEEAEARENGEAVVEEGAVA